MTASPIIYVWNGDAMVPLQRFAARCNKEFCVGERYRLVEEDERSRASHNHFFAALHEFHLNWPEYANLQFGSEDELRKHALILTGWAIERKAAFSSNKDATQAMAFAMQMAREYSLFSVSGNVMVALTARSQKMRGPERMSKQEFNKSKSDVLEWIEAYLHDLRKTRGEAA